ncbi:TIGR03086 family metal-binding protein [Streptomyces sp. NPDC059943]|uniref:TIGR03086 family metal-binding protein n=2 Tax=unclassified Streptomyces TaxID=2593676 RepID=UPI00364E1E4C
MNSDTSSDTGGGTSGPVDTVYPAMRECAAEAARIADHVPAGRLPDRTPSADWDVRTLANHLVLYTSHGLEHRARRTEMPGTLTARDFTSDADWPERYRVALDRAVAAWADPAVWEGEIGEGPGATPAVSVGTLMTLEMALHGWELARATGQEFRISEETAAFVLGVVDEYAEMYRKYDGFADPVPLPATAGTFDRALAASGRDPGWTATPGPSGD